MQRVKFGFGLKHPPSFMVRKNKEISSDDEGNSGTNKVKKKDKVKKSCKDNDKEWVPEKNIKPRSQRKEHVCENCRETYSSKRLFNTHSCSSAAQGIAGRHLQGMNDQDLLEMGINKGSRMDILKVVRDNNNKGSLPPHHVNDQSSGCPPRSLVMSQHPPSSEKGPQSIVPNSFVRSPSSSWLSDSVSQDSGMVPQYSSANNRGSGSVAANPNRFVNSTFSRPSTSIDPGQGIQQNFQCGQSINHESRTNMLPHSSANERGPGSVAANPNRFLSSIERRNLNFQSGESTNSFGSTTPVMSSIERGQGRNQNFQSGDSTNLFGSTAPVMSPIERGQGRNQNCQSGNSTNLIRSSTPVMSQHHPTALGAVTDNSNCSSSETSDSGDMNSDERVNRLITTAASKLKCGFNILNILRSSRNGSVIATTLENEGYINDVARKSMSNILVYHINKSGLEANPVLMREEMAILLALSFPKMRMKLHRRSDLPWHHWFNANSNTGFLQNANVGFQRSAKKLTGQGIRRSNKVPGAPRKLIELPTNRQEVDADGPDPPEFTRNVTEARNLLATAAEKDNIMELMKKTFDRRRVELEFKQLSPGFTLDRYPHFLSFGGEVIEQEFNLMHPKCSSLFLRTFSLDFVPQITKLARENLTKYGELVDYFGDELLNAVLVLGKMLPCPRRSYAHEARQSLHPNVVDLVHIIPLGCDPRTEAAKRRADARCQVQPHLMITGHPKALGKIHIVCGNGDLFELPREASPTNGIDLLFKTYFALHLHFPLGWKNMFRFLQVHVYDVPVDNPRESVFQDVMMKISNAR